MQIYPDLGTYVVAPKKIKTYIFRIGKLHLLIHGRAHPIIFFSKHAQEFEYQNTIQCSDFNFVLSLLSTHC